jgi:hypothetical protein
MCTECEESLLKAKANKGFRFFQQTMLKTHEKKIATVLI